MVSSSIWCSAPNKVVEQELLLLLVWFEGHPSSPGFARRTPEAFCFPLSTSLLSLRLCYTCAHLGMPTWVYTSTRSATATALAVLQPRQPPLLLGPCASPLSHSFSGYRPSHFKRVHLFRDAPRLRRDLLVSHLCPLLSFERRNSSILCLAPP